MSNTETIPGKRRSRSCSGEEHNARRWTGILLLIIGGAALAKSFLVPLPASVFNWQTLLIVIGIFIGVRNSFRGSAWLILIIVGSAFLLNDFYFIGDLHKHVWPLVLIAVGAVFIFRPRYSNQPQQPEKETDRKDRSASSSAGNQNFADITIIFGSAKKNMITKNFTGGDITSIFGGAELDLTNADFEGKAVIDITTIFGGTHLIVPSGWTVKSEIVSVFASVKDKRVQSPGMIEDPGKTLILDGTAMFGGIEIRDFSK